MHRRDFLSGLAAAGVTAAALGAAPAQGGGQARPVTRKGRIRQGLMRQNFGAGSKLSFDDMCREAARLGAVGFDLIQPQDWPTLRKHGLVCTCAPAIGVTFQDGLIRPEVHDKVAAAMSDAIDLCATGGCSNMITVGGQRRGMSYEQGAENATAFFNKVKARAEDKGVTISLEIMNSRYPDNVLGRPDQVFDHLAWGVDVCKRVNSPRIKVLFDIYHVQIADGNVVANIRDNYAWISHFHTAGVPGRNELDDTQELNYRFIAQAIADLGFTGVVTHEFRPGPGRDPIASIDQAIGIMDV